MSSLIEEGQVEEEQVVKEEEEEEQDDGETEQYGRKRKRAILFGYSGSGFSGLQTQQGGVVHLDFEAEAMKDPNDTSFDTIEDALFHALSVVGAIQESNRESFQKVRWTRSARTDRGVHAASQVVSAKLRVPGQELGLGGDVSRRDEEAFVSKVNAQLPSQIRVYRCFRVTTGFNARWATTSRSYGYFLPEFALKRKHDGSMPSLFDLRQALKMFEGSHLFHNFTEKLGPKDPRARRVIESFTASEPMELDDGTRVIRLQVKGQSFLKHHIRRMVGFVVECLRCACNVEQAMKEALSGEVVLPNKKRMEMPTAPAEALFLDVAYFDQYNASIRKQADTDNKKRIKLDKDGKDEETVAAREPIDFVADATVRSAREKLVSGVVLPAIFTKEHGAVESFEKWLKERDEFDFPPGFMQLDMPIELQDAQEFLRGVERNRAKRLKNLEWVRTENNQATTTS